MEMSVGWRAALETKPKVPEESPLGAQRWLSSRLNQCEFLKRNCAWFHSSEQISRCGKLSWRGCLPRVNVDKSMLGFGAVPKVFVTFYKPIAFLQMKLAWTVILMSLQNYIIDISLRWSHNLPWIWGGISFECTTQAHFGCGEANGNAACFSLAWITGIDKNLFSIIWTNIFLKPWEKRAMFASLLWLTLPNVGECVHSDTVACAAWWRLS